MIKQNDCLKYGIENPGILLSGMTIDDMKQGVSKIRSPVVARVFRELGFIEQWGSDVRWIFRKPKNLDFRNVK